MPKRILILGGGTGGVVAAKKLVEVLGRPGELYEVTLVSDNPDHEFQPLYFDVALSTAKPEEVKAPLQSLEKLGVRVVIDRVVRIDAANRRVYMSRGSLDYDYLIVSLGVRYGWDAYPGLEQAGYHNYTLEGALELRKALAGFRGGRVVLLVPELPHRCGMYPHEAVTTLAEGFKARGIKAEVVLVTPEKEPMGALAPDFPRLWREKYEELGIEMVTHNGLQEVDPARRVVRAGNVEERYDLLIKVPPSRLPEPLARSEGFALKGDERWAVTDPRSFRHPRYDDVFMVGEHSMPAAGLPTAGIPVHYASEYAAEQIAGELTGYPTRDMTKVMTCVGYYGASSGLAGNCEVYYDEKAGRRRLRCTVAAVSPFIRLLKEAFYKAWIASMK